MLLFFRMSPAVESVVYSNRQAVQMHERHPLLQRTPRFPSIDRAFQELFSSIRQFEILIPADPCVRVPTANGHLYQHLPELLAMACILQITGPGGDHLQTSEFFLRCPIASAVNFTPVLAALSPSIRSPLSALGHFSKTLRGKGRFVFVSRLRVL